MATQNRIGSADYTAMNSIDTSTTAPATNYFQNTIKSAETERSSNEYMSAWGKWRGYYNVIPELQSVIDKKAIWTCGKGVKADGETKKILDKIRGNGKDTFNSIVVNLIRTYTICGDAFAEIIKTKRGELRNLKPINPGTIKIVSNDAGIIIRYEQWQQGKLVATFEPENILHLAWNRLGDDIHGISTIEKLQDVINARNEAMSDIRKVFHRYVKPLWVFSVDTDDPTAIANFKTKIDKSIELSENMIVPKDTVANIERVSIPQFSTLDPLPWLQALQKYFIISEGVPEVILGSAGGTTEASSKILYLAFQQMIEWNQKFLEEQFLAQADLEIQFEFPASIEPSLLGDSKKDSKLNDKGDGGIGIGNEGAK